MNIEFSNNMNKTFIGNMDLIIHSISKQEIENQNIQKINKCIEILRINTRKSCNKLMITFDGYDNDSREIYEIQEIRNYVSKMFKQNKDLFYFLTNLDQNNKLILACMSDFQQVKKRNSRMVSMQYKIDTVLKSKIIEGVFQYINNDTRKLNIILENLFNI